MNGSPATSTIDFGIVAAIDCSRVARPPARMATGGSRVGDSSDDNLGAFEIEAEAHFRQAGLAHSVA